AFHSEVVGLERGVGLVVWSPGLSVGAGDAGAGSSPSSRGLGGAGWDVFRFDGPRGGDTLTASTRRLVEQVDELKRKGYHRIVLAGQSFGAFLALMAADASEGVDAVVATSPAAFGRFPELHA